MPVILAEEHHAKWLGEMEDGDLKKLLEPFPAERMKMWPISPRVNSPDNNDERVLEPIEPLKFGPQDPNAELPLE
jgi:putative SOS response-associated peptidase YedK